ncbi:hypothetical protein C5B42_05705 [Candidatus Cerribacteria bacterium 'Amazon FNV 2010 28 9']|uniref:Type II secretion system protein GspG C-terminal domain-containing protein n=1 Tax=Candidatus Cerribacteria bacterium 'Amazon FNV 2010 28 9' TaxID=2081795 RepID=A0A317JN35_9BACT|nr:MAG: hypothetical protein C5B42_05705 [Candidatus Cerribacteria bacterium 'Amazon FNV 2010 28 9']
MWEFIRYHRSMHSATKHQRGFTLIEILIVASLLAILMILTFVTYDIQVKRGFDSQRKSDFAKLKIAFEDYYNDHKCYPPTVVMNACNSTALQPYMVKVPCDPESKQPYGYVLDSNCGYYGLFTTLDDTKDTDIAKADCSPTCGLPNATYNYAVTDGGTPLSTIVSNAGGTSGANQSSPGNYACDPLGSCNVYANPSQKGCPATFADYSTCQQACGNPANRCLQ